MPAEPREYVPDEPVELCVAAHPLLQAGEDFLVAVDEHLQLSWNEEAEGPGGYHVLKRWHEY